MSGNGKIHVAHITQYLTIGGLESFIVEFCRKMDLNAFAATVLCLNGYDESYKKRLEQCGVAVHLIKKSCKYDFMFLIKAASFLKNIKVDIVHSHGGCFFYSSLIARFAGVKGFVYTAHGLPVTSGVQARLEEMSSCFMADRIVAVSDEIAEDLVSRQKGAARKIDVIINGIDPEKFRPIEDTNEVAERKAEYGLPTDRKIIGSVGRLEKVKNYPLLLHAFAELIRSGSSNFHLVLVGSGMEEGNLKTLAYDLGIAEHVSFLGMQYDLHRIYPMFDVFVLSSLTEGTSLSLLEALSCGVPAIATDVGGNSRIITNGFNGFLSPSGDRDALTAHLVRFLTDDAEQLNMRKRARMDILDRFDLTAMVKKYQEIYNACVDRAAIPSATVTMKSQDIAIS